MKPILCFVFLFVFCAVRAQSSTARITVVQTVGAHDTITLKWWPELLDAGGYTTSESTTMQQSGTSVSFDIDFAGAGRVVYFQVLREKKMVAGIWPIEQGDALTIDLTTTKSLLAGKGAVKQQLYQKVDSLFADWKLRSDTVSEQLAPGIARQYAYPARMINDNYNWRRKIAIANTWLDSIKENLSDDMFQWIKADIIGKAWEQMLFAATIYGSNFPSSFPVEVKDSLQKRIWELYLQDRPDLILLPGSVPMYYITWLMKEMIRTPLPQCLQPLQWINSHFNAVWKDRLLAAFLERSGRLLSDSMQAEFNLSISSPHYRNRVASLLNRIKPGQPAFPFRLTGIDGKPVTLEQFKNRLVVLDFWFTGCSGCKAMAPVLHQIADSFRENKRVTFVSVSMDADVALWKKSVKSGEYTSALFMQAYTEGTGFDHSLISEYMIRSAPSIVILQGGKYVSSQLPEGKDSVGPYVTYLKSLLPSDTE